MASYDNTAFYGERTASQTRCRSPYRYADPVPANIMLPTLSLEQLMEEDSLDTRDIVDGSTETAVQCLLEEFSALCPGDQITMLRCMAAAFYRNYTFVPYACLQIITSRLRVMYAREVIHTADDLVDVLRTADCSAFRRHRQRILEDMLDEEMDVYRYLMSANEDITEDNLLTAVETLLRRFKHLGCYRSLCMLKILALQHEDLALFIKNRIAEIRKRAHARTHTVYV
ncbi:NF-kappaB inhibitor [Bovine papular stomatitis virus]|uniref:NF-kappaB inhibitor n=1 Tax=Bovine papular stomatitis virus TaxID=129727 RepID=A0A0E3T6P8_9POXV|nr:NF-kappaB inhibitor [Bovine papular stomatitis virus]AKC03322.1 NF-kappaB inhibitor [Bovine papular stomatitis virus]